LTLKPSIRIDHPEGYRPVPEVPLPHFEWIAAAGRLVNRSGARILKLCNNIRRRQRFETIAYNLDRLAAWLPGLSRLGSLASRAAEAAKAGDGEERLRCGKAGMLMGRDLRSRVCWASPRGLRRAR